MGWYDLSDIMKYPGTSCVALCDIDSGILSNRAAEAEKNKRETLVAMAQTSGEAPAAEATAEA